MVRATTDNLLLAGLGASSRASLLAVAEPVMLLAGERLYEADDRLAYAYFPGDAAISLVLCGSDMHSLDVGVVGREGMLGVGLICDAPVAEFRADVQCTGRALKVASAHFRRQLAEHPAFRSRMNRYAYVRLLQLAQDVTCHNHHLMEGRLACQLLLARDRARSDHIALTHEALARLLGVRRAGITQTASELRARALVRYSRGNIQVLDAAGLRASACACYSIVKRTYSRFLDSGGAPE